MLHLVEELCRRVAIIVRGRKVVDGSLEEIRAAQAQLGHDTDLEAIFMRAVEDGSGE